MEKHWQKDEEPSGRGEFDWLNDMDGMTPPSRAEVSFSRGPASNGTWLLLRSEFLAAICSVVCNYINYDEYPQFITNE